MKSKPHTKYLAIAAIGLAFSFGFSAHAEPPREELIHALHLLQKADHDYDGHRVKAVQEVEVASRELGLEVGGEAPERERQWKSDRQLEEARRLLREAREKMEHRDRDRVAEHLEKAVQEINMALKVR